MSYSDLSDDELIRRWQHTWRKVIDEGGGDLMREYTSLRTEGYRRGIDMHSVPPMPRPVDVVQRELERIERRMERLHRRANSRAQATTREANLGQLGRIAQALRDELERAKEVVGL